MRAPVALLLTILASTNTNPPQVQASELDQQEACLESAMAHYADLKHAAIETMQHEVKRCEVSGSDEFSDRCYGIVGRKLASALDQAKVLLDAEQKACLH